MQQPFSSTRWHKGGITWASFCAALLLTLAPRPTSADDGSVELAERARNSAASVAALLGAEDQSVPTALLERAHCIAVIPKVVKAGFVVAVRAGEGLVTCRHDADWSRPSFIAIKGASLGFQVGVQATDFVLVFTNRKAIDRLFEDNLTLGGNASVSAGPLGRTAEAGTDFKLDSEIYSYSRSKGVFAGVSIEGSELSVDEDNNAFVYGKGTTAQELLSGPAGGAPEMVEPFLAAVRAHVPAPTPETRNERPGH